MSAHGLSASKIDLFLACQWWARGDVVARMPPKVLHPNATSGLLDHAEVKAELRDEIPAQRPSARVALEVLRRHVPDGVLVVSELAMVWNLETHAIRILWDAGEREYGEVGPMDLPGTGDLLWKDRDGLPHISDIKTGQVRYLPAAASSGQLGILAGMYQAAFSLTAPIRVSYLATQIKSFLPVAELDQDSITDLTDDVRYRLKTLPLSKPQPNKDCWKCDAKTICPDYRGKR